MSFLNPFRGSSTKATKATAGSPLELINYDPTSGQFRLGKEALSVLRGVKGPVGVVAVCGRARQGKSFILNQLLGQSTGFVVAPTHRPCTKGLWMWSTPVERQNADGSKYHLVLLDTEGIDAYDQTGQYSTQIFSLAVLLSSLFVYNQMGGIDEAALDRLSLVTEMTKHIRVRAGAAAAEGEQELADFTPSFLWLLRDFYLTLEEDGRQLTPREYLETALHSVEGRGPSVDAKNRIRESIKNLFPNRDCFSMVRPMSDENQLAKLDSIPPDQMRPQFIEGLKKLTRLIFMRAQPKRLGNQIITGGMLAALASAYVDAINHGAVPTIATAWQGVAEAECRRAADAAEAAYIAAFNKAVPSEEASLNGEHQRCMIIARQAYAEGAIGEESVKRANEQRYVERLSKQFEQFRQQRVANSESECRKLISDITTQLTQMASRNSTTLEDIQREVSSWEAAYDKAPGTSGPAKWRLHADFMHKTYNNIVTGVVHRQEQQAKAERAQAAERQRDFDHRLQQGASQVAALERQLAAAKQELTQEQQQRQQSQSRVAALEQQLSAAQQTQARVQETERRLAQASSSHNSQAADLQQQLQQARSQAEASSRQAQQQTSSLKSQLESAQKEAAQARQQLEGFRTSHDSQASEAQRQLQSVTAESASLKGQLESAHSQLTEANRARQEAAGRVAQLEAQLLARPSEPAAGVEDMDEGYGTPDEDQTANLTPGKMTVMAIKDWLTEHGHENVVWDLTQAKAKKPRYVEEMNKVLGRS